MSASFNQELFDALPIVGIMRHFPAAQLDAVVEAYQGAGLSTLEITMNSEGAADTIRSLRERWGKKMNIGAGTVLTKKDLEAALESGAQFIVMPVVNKAVIKACVKQDVPVFPGAMTPTEIYQAWKWGATAVKVFPARGLGPTYIKDVLEPLNEVKLMPTGGVSPENFVDFLKAGAAGVGIATALFPKDIIGGEDWEGLRRFYAEIAGKYRSFRSGKLQNKFAFMSTTELPKGLSAPAKRALEAAGISTLADLVRFTESEVGQLHGIGRNALEKLSTALTEAGLDWKKPL